MITFSDVLTWQSLDKPITCARAHIPHNLPLTQTVLRLSKMRALENCWQTQKSHEYTCQNKQTSLWFKHKAPKNMHRQHQNMKVLL